MSNLLLPSVRKAALPEKYEAAKLLAMSTAVDDFMRLLQEGKPPQKSGVYGFWHNGICVYIGQSRNIWKRMKGHERKIEWPGCTVKWVECENHVQAEPWLIKGLHPTGNGRTCHRFKQNRPPQDIDEVCLFLFGKTFLGTFARENESDEELLKRLVSKRETA